MGKELYDSLVSKIAPIVPMFAKAIVDMGLEKYNVTPYTVTPAQMRRIISEDIIPKMKKFIRTPEELEAMSGGVIMVDRNDKVISINLAARRLIGIGREVPWGDKKIYEKASQLGLIQPTSEISKLGEHVLIKGVKLEQPNVTLNIISGPIRNERGEITGAIFFLQDVTLRAALESESDRLYLELETTKTSLEERKLELEVLNRELIRSNSELDEFTYAVSHDLKEPLRGIEAFSIFLKDRYFEVIGEKGKHYIDSIISSVTKMKNLIDDLLSLSRVTRKRERYVEVDLNKLLADIRDEFQYTISEKKAKLNVLTLPTIRCEKAKIELVFSNLVANALKYNDKKEPLVEVGSGEYEGGKCQFYVRDNGKGIEEQYFGKIFEIFQRLERNENEGTGAGLAIVKKIVESYGGRIWVESKVGKGSTFYFTLPKKKED